MNEKLKKAILELAKGICTAIIGFITAFLVSSCGTTRAVVRANAQNTTSEIKITTNNPTTVTVTPSIKIDSTNLKF